VLYTSVMRHEPDLAAPMSQNDPKRTSFALIAETEAKQPDDPLLNCFWEDRLSEMTGRRLKLSLA
jgi:hypothetical protein